MPGAVSISNSASSKANQNHKKKVQILLKKTHFTENEINRLLDLHYQIMVSTTISQITVLKVFTAAFPLHRKICQTPVSQQNANGEFT